MTSLEISSSDKPRSFFNNRAVSAPSSDGPGTSVAGSESRIGLRRHPQLANVIIDRDVRLAKLNLRIVEDGLDRFERSDRATERNQRIQHVLTGANLARVSDRTVECVAVLDTVGVGLKPKRLELALRRRWRE